MLVAQSRLSERYTVNKSLQVSGHAVSRDIAGRGAPELARSSLRWRGAWRLLWRLPDLALRQLRSEFLSSILSAFASERSRPQRDRRSKNRRRKICIFGNFGSTNFGNEITVQTILIQLNHRFPNAELVCICMGPEALAATQNIKAVPISRNFIRFWKPHTRPAQLLKRVFIGMPSELGRWLDAFNTLKKADVMIIPGTGLLSDAYGLLGWGPYNLFKWSLIARVCRCKLMFVSVGAGPLYGALGRYFVKSALSLANFRSYRDAASKNYLKGIGFPVVSDRTYPDLVFGFPEAMLPHAADKKNKRTVVGLGLMICPGKYSVANPSIASYREYLRSLVVFVRWLLANNYDIRLILGDLQDRIALDDFKALLRTSLGQYDEERIIDEPALSVEQLLPQIAATDIMVATRFHNVLLALVLNKPVISISFHHKCASLMSDIGLTEYCHDINHMNAKELIEQFQDVEKNAEKMKALIMRRVEESRKALDEQSNIIYNSI